MEELKHKRKKIRSYSNNNYKGNSDGTTFVNRPMGSNINKMEKMPEGHKD
jgi:hypothetical protein